MPGPQKPRLPFLDWMRGVAAIIMLQGHTFHSFARPDLRDSGPYVLSQFFGGIGPAIFLFLTGITFGFIMERGERQQLSVRDRFVASLKRARYLIALAMLFRFQLWLFAQPQSPWTDLFKVDVLNCMALTFIVLSPLAIVSLQQRIRWGAVAGVLIAAAAPLVANANWSWLPDGVSAYLVPSHNYFALFPWASFIAFGLSAGSVLKAITAEQVNRVMQWSALAGFALILSGNYFSNLPYSLYAKTEFWLDSPALVFIKLGILLVLGAFSYLWAEHVVRDRWSWVKQLGATSLMVYWVHVEIVYGRWFGSWKETLDNYQVAAFSIALILAMLALSVTKTRWTGFRLPAWVPAWVPASSQLTPRRVSGD